LQNGKTRWSEWNSKQRVFGQKDKKLLLGWGEAGCQGASLEFNDFLGKKFGSLLHYLSLVVAGTPELYFHLCDGRENYTLGFQFKDGDFPLELSGGTGKR